MKRLSNEAVINLLALVGIALIALWLAFNTEWVDVWRPTPPRGEAARDEYYAIKKIASRLGAEVASPGNLDALPPPGATLVLASQQWDFVPGRVDTLRQWVEVHGGHLVLPVFSTVGEDMPWVPIRELPRPKARDDDAKAHARKPPVPRSPGFVGPIDDLELRCRSFAERDATGASAPQGVRLCGGEWALGLAPSNGARPLWSIDGAKAPALLRVPVGQGRVTVIGTYGLATNDRVFMGDHARAAVAALDLRPGQPIWFVADESRDALLVWLWRCAGPALALAALAAAFALWRGALRFGPLLPQPSLARRSVAEQIRGTSAFIVKQDAQPLLAASGQALGAAARQRLARYDRMTVSERATALATPTGLAAEALVHALDPRRPTPKGRALADALALLETARRRLINNT